ncbi:hypothetical protein D3C85_979510 [compost metagenome]
MHALFLGQIRNGVIHHIHVLHRQEASGGGPAPIAELVLHADLHHVTSLQHVAQVDHAAGAVLGIAGLGLRHDAGHAIAIVLAEHDAGRHGVVGIRLLHIATVVQERLGQVQVIEVPMPDLVGNDTDVFAIVTGQALRLEGVDATQRPITGRGRLHIVLASRRKSAVALAVVRRAGRGARNLHDGFGLQALAHRHRHRLDLGAFHQRVFQQLLDQQFRVAAAHHLGRNLVVAREVMPFQRGNILVAAHHGRQGHQGLHAGGQASQRVHRVGHLGRRRGALGRIGSLGLQPNVDGPRFITLCGMPRSGKCRAEHQREHR